MTDKDCGWYNHNGIWQRADGWYNDDTGYGGASDSIKNTRYLTDAPLTAEELEAMYNGRDETTRKGVDIPVDDRLGKGIEFIEDDDDSEGRAAEMKALEKDMKALKAISSLIEGEKWARLYGGGLLYFEFGDEERFRSQSESVDSLTQGRGASVAFELPEKLPNLPSKIWVVDRWRATPMSYYNEFRHGADHPKLGEAETYSVTLQTTGWSKLVFAHESRCIKIDGLPLPPRIKAQNHMWGASIVQAALDIIKYFGVGKKALADTLEDFNWKSLEVENLAELIASNDTADIETLTRAAALAAKNYHNQSIGLHGKETTLTKHATTVTGLTDMVSLFSNFVASAFHPGIPDSIFFSAKGGALGGTSAESDIRNYFKALRRIQENKDRPAIERIIELLGRDPENFPFVFPKMEEPTEMEQIEARDKQAEVDKKYLEAGVVLAEEIRASRFSRPETNLNQTIIDPELDEMVEYDEEDMGEEPTREPEKTVVDEIEEEEK